MRPRPSNLFIPRLAVAGVRVGRGTVSVRADGGAGLHRAPFGGLGCWRVHGIMELKVSKSVEQFGICVHDGIDLAFVRQHSWRRI